MNPILFSANVTSLDKLQGMGIGALKDVTSCHVVEDLNGDFYLEMNLRSSDDLFHLIEIGNMIVAKPNDTDSNQAFVIEEIEKDIDGSVDIYATHIAQHRTKLIPVNEFDANSLSQAISRGKNNSMEWNPFDLLTNKTSTATFKIETPRSYREFLGGKRGSLLDVYGGEYFWNNFEIQLLNRRGQDTNVRILYGLNMTELNVDDEFSFDSSITGIFPYWFKEDEGIVKGSIQYTSNANNYAYKKTIPVDFTNDFDSKPTVAQLNNIARIYLVDRGLAKRNLRVSFAQIQNFETGDSLSNSQFLHLGDTVTVIYSPYEIEYQSRIIETDYDVLLERYNSMTIGDKKTTVNDAIQSIAETVVDDFTIVASDIKYSNIGSGAEAETVQGAIDELFVDISDLLTNRIGAFGSFDGNMDNYKDDAHSGVWFVDMGTQTTGTKPTTVGQGILIVKRQNGATYRQVYIVSTGSGNNATMGSVYQRYYTISTGTWSSWTSNRITDSTSIQFPSGLILKRGSQGISHSTSSTIITFPSAFPSACIAVVAMPMQVGFGAYSTVAVGSITKTNFRITNYNSASAPMQIQWYAIGI